MQRLADNLIRDVRPVVVTRIDVIDAAGHCFAQHCECGLPVFRWAEDTRSGELHGAVSQTLYGAVAQLERPGFADIGHGLSPVNEAFTLAAPKRVR